MSTFCPWFQVRSFDQRLPRGQADQRDGSRFCHGEGCGLHRHVVFFDRNEFRECADSPVGRPRIDFVAGLESTHSRSDADHDPGHVMAQNERQAIPQKGLELAVSDFGIQKVHTSGVNLDQDVILPRFRIWHVASPHAIGASVTIEDECLHLLLPGTSTALDGVLQEPIGIRNCAPCPASG